MATVAREVRSSQRKAWREEWPFTVELLSLGDLFSDDRYQRPPIDSFIEAKAAIFDPTLVGTIDVANRDGESYAILDGRQRSEIVKRVGKKSVWCSVYDGMTLKDEAEFFFRKNRERRNMHPFYAIRARAVAGDDAATAVFDIVDKTKFKLSTSGSRDYPENITAVASVEEAYGYSSLLRAESLTPTLRTIEHAFYGREAATEGTIIRGLGRFWQAYSDDEVMWDRLIESLSETGPKKLIGYSLDRVASSRKSKAELVAEQVVQIYNKGLRRERKLVEQYLYKVRS